MATTPRGYVYQSDVNAPNNVPGDLQALAESIDTDVAAQAALVDGHRIRSQAGAVQDSLRVLAFSLTPSTDGSGQFTLNLSTVLSAITYVGVTAFGSTPVYGSVTNAAANNLTIQLYRGTAALASTSLQVRLLIIGTKA